MAEPILIMLDVNNRGHALHVALTETLLTTLRERLLLTGSKRGCNQGVCGACTVMIDEVPMRACLSLSANCEGSAIRTIEGFDDDAMMQRLKDAFVGEGALQCGFCTAGMLVASHALLASNEHPSIDEVRDRLSGNLCRCTGYRKIIKAVRCAAEGAGV